MSNVTNYDNNGKINQTKKKKEKSTGTIVAIFIVMIVGSMIAGMFLGDKGRVLSESGSFEAVLKAATPIAVKVTPYLSVALNVVLCIIGFATYFKYNKLTKSWDGEDEDMIDRIEDGLSIPMNISSIALILNYLLFAVGTTDIKDSSFTGIAIVIAAFIASMVWETVLQGLVVGLEKKLNPEKKGNILDTGFQKEWVNSCDEAEQLIIYKSAYEAFKTTNMTLTTLWVVTMLGNLMLGTGIFPIVIVILVWLVSFLKYSITAQKLSKKNR